MPLVIGLVAIVGAVLLLTSGITDASFADVLSGKAGQLYRQNQTPAGSTGASSTTAAATTNSAGYINPLQHASSFGRTDQGVDASLPAGAPIPAPGRVKILQVIPDWFEGQPAIFFELLDGPDAGQVQYVAEQITKLAPVGAVLQQGDAIAIGASSGTGIEYGWGTSAGQTLAAATTGYVEGEATAAGNSMRNWLKSLGAPV